MSTAYLFEGLKAHYRARGLTYRDVAKVLKISESTVKRIFSTRDCTLARLEELCAVVQVDIAEIARGAPRTARLITRLTQAQEQELVDDLRLLIVAVCAMGNVPLEDIVRVYAISKAQCIGLLAKMVNHDMLRLALITGFLGGFTTFSAYSLETLNLFRNNTGVGVIVYIDVFTVTVLNSVV